MHVDGAVELVLSWVLTSGRVGVLPLRHHCDGDRYTVHPRHHPKIVEVYEEWVRSKVKVKGHRMQKCMHTTLGYELSVRQTNRLIHDVIGIDFGKRGSKRDFKDRNSEKDDCCRRFAVLLKLEDADYIVIVYWDESYIHSNHDVGCSWGPAEHGNGKGLRIILSHALTKDGLVVGVPVGTPMNEWTEGVHCRTKLRPWGKENSERPAGPVPLTAEWGWQANAKGDYHNMMNSSTFMCWTVEQLIPAVEAMCPPEANPKLLGFVHVEDNAPVNPDPTPSRTEHDTKKNTRDQMHLC
jgi:hypothetical protein